MNLQMNLQKTKTNGFKKIELFAIFLKRGLSKTQLIRKWKWHFLSKVKTNIISSSP